MKKTDEEMIKDLEDPINFIELFLERNLSDKQKLFIRKTESHRHIVAIWSRQTGKSTVIASYILWRLLYGKGCVINDEHMPEHIAIVAPIKDQIKNLYDKIRSLVDKNDFIPSFLKKMNSEVIIAKNGNEAKFLSASPGSQIRGYTATCIVIDESQDITDNKYNADILPFGATTNALIIEAGTPKTKNHFYQAMVSKSVLTIKQPWFECPFLSEEYVMRQRETSPEALWRQEYLCEFMEEGVLAFPSKLFDPEEREGKLTGRWNLGDYEYIDDLEKFVDAKITGIRELITKEGASFRAGLDLGKTNDNTVLTIIRDDVRPLKVALQVKFPLDTAYTKIARDIAFLYNIFQPYEFNIDYSNEKSFIDILIDHGVPVTLDGKNVKGAIAFTNKNKSEMVNTARILLENYQLNLPKSADTLITQFLNQQFEVSETGVYKYYHPSNEHDDMLWSTLLALKNIPFSSVIDTISFKNPWEKYDEETHGSKRDYKDALSTSKHYRNSTRRVHISAESRRNVSFRL